MRDFIDAICGGLFKKGVPSSAAATLRETVMAVKPHALPDDSKIGEALERGLDSLVDRVLRGDPGVLEAAASQLLSLRERAAAGDFGAVMGVVNALQAAGKGELPAQAGQAATVASRVAALQSVEQNNIAVISAALRVCFPPTSPMV